MVLKNYLSRISKFSELAKIDKKRILSNQANIPIKKLSLFLPEYGLDSKTAGCMIENNIGVFGLPIGVVLNFVLNKKPVIIPMVTEEPSIVASCSFLGYIISKSGGFYSKVTNPIMIGQINIAEMTNIHKAKIILDTNKSLIIRLINKLCINMVNRGGGCVYIKSRIVHPLKNIIHSQYDSKKPFMIINFYINCCEAMGANIINTTLESITDIIKSLLNCNIGMRIISNLSTQRIAKSYCKIPFFLLDKSLNFKNGEKIADGIVNAYRVSIRDPYRACTHNKGIMNGIDALALATGNDWRAIEAAAHSYASREGHYTSLTIYKSENGFLKCYIELPLALGIIGGCTRLHPLVPATHKILGDLSKDSRKLSGLMASVGLCQNLAALKALVSEGIQRGHMSLHLKQFNLST